MKFIHRIGVRATPAQRRELEALGVKLPAGVSTPGGGDPVVAFDVAEDHPSWPTLQLLLRRWPVSDFLRTEFSQTEIDSAEWLGLGAEHKGYPQPRADSFGYREVTYDLTDWCEKCGAGMKQKAPFQLKGEPKWGRLGIFQLNWVFDEYFVKPEVWTSVFKPHGIGCRSVTNTKGAELETVVQLVAGEEVGLMTDGLPAEKCSSCGRVKYLPIKRGMLPSLEDEPSSAMVRTREYFGSGAAADNGVLVSAAVGSALAAQKVRGTWLRPVAKRPTKQDSPDACVARVT